MLTSRPGVSSLLWRYSSRGGASLSATSDTRVIDAPWPAASEESRTSPGTTSV